VQDKIALDADEENTLGVKREVIGGQERTVWSPALSIPAKDFEFRKPETVRMKAALQTWGSIWSQIGSLVARALDQCSLCVSAGIKRPHFCRF
jgi:hypothetical protein